MARASAVTSLVFGMRHIECGTAKSPPFMIPIRGIESCRRIRQASSRGSCIRHSPYFALIVLLAKRSGLGAGANPACENNWSRTQAYAVLIAFSLPFLSANLFSGQTGALIAVFFLGAAYFWPTRPILAGICIG